MCVRVCVFSARSSPWCAGEAADQESQSLGEEVRTGSLCESLSTNTPKLFYCIYFHWVVYWVYYTCAYLLCTADTFPLWSVWPRGILRHQERLPDREDVRLSPGSVLQLLLAEVLVSQSESGSEPCVSNVFLCEVIRHIKAAQSLLPGVFISLGCGGRRDAVRLGPSLVTWHHVSIQNHHHSSSSAGLWISFLHYFATSTFHYQIL